MAVRALVSDNQKRLRGRGYRHSLLAFLRGLLGSILRWQRAGGKAAEVLFGETPGLGGINIARYAQRHIRGHIILFIKSLRIGTAEVLDVAGPSSGHIAVWVGCEGSGGQSFYQLALGT